MRVIRSDNVRLDKVERTPGGGVRIPAIVTRPGVFAYRDSDGNEIREYRPPEEVAKADSLASLRDAPVTVGHPAAPVTAASWKRDAVGHVTEPVASGDGIATSVVVNDADAIAKIDARELQEISCGYGVEIEATPGTTPDGQRYDRVQRSITYNHVALGPDGWGRQGSGVALRLDAAGNEIAAPCSDCGLDITSKHDAHLPWDECMAKAMKEYGDETTARKVCGSIKAKYGDAADVKCPMCGKMNAAGAATCTKCGAMMPAGHGDSMKQTIVIDGKEHVTEAGSVDAISLQARADAARDAAIVAEKKRADEACARADAAEKSVKDLQARLDAAPAEIAKKLAARAQLEQSARKVLGPEYKFDGKTDREVRIDAIRKSDATFTPEGRSDDYCAARFDAEAARESPSVRFVKDSERADTAAAGDKDGDIDFDLAKRRQEIDNLWKRPKMKN